ncbi:MAG: type I DNA topoisomerase [Tepidisphaeraceae bacterium]
MAKRTGKNLVIVESPAKAKTINKYLGDDYVVKASMGHVRDLPRSGMGVDLETFTPEYVLITERGKEKVVSELKKLAKDAPEIYLATDLDREGEAIAWHLKEALKLPDDRVQRVMFNAITKEEIKKAFDKPTKLDMDRVNAQQARRVLDRIVGFEISPVLWRKVARGLSAGRVQSVAVRLVVEREREIEAFVPDEYWTIGAIFGATNDPKLAEAWNKFISTEVKNAKGDLAPPNQKQQQKWLGEHGLFEAELIEAGGKKVDSLDAKTARSIAEAVGFVVTKENVVEDPEAKGPAQRRVNLVGALKNAPALAINSIEQKRTTSRPPPPFITSTLQQAASSRLGFGAQRTMRAAQGLYEAGHITYMRTDSTHLSGDALTMARGFIKSEFGDKYLPEKPNFFTSSNKSAQEAHEAIRPTNLNTLPKKFHSEKSDEVRLYELIYNRFVACQMTPAVWDQTTVLISAQTKVGECVFKASGRKLVFDGFMRVAGVSSDDQLLPELAEKQPVYAVDVKPTQHFTAPPPRYTEASLIKDLESKGIGRPSTYASIVQTIQDRQYVVQIDRRFHASLLGKVVTDKLIQAFPKILDVTFTANMESELDKVEESHTDWIKLLKDFYGPFHDSVGKSMEILEHAGGSPSPYTCDKCGKKMLYRISANGFFLACEDRECGNTKPVDVHGKPVVREVSPYTCPKCGREMIKRKGRFGEFLSCSGYSVKNEKGEPSCSMIINLDKRGKPEVKAKPIQTTVLCDKCKNPMLLRGSKRGPFLGCSTFPKCRGTKWYAKLNPEEKASVDALLPQLNQNVAEAKELAAKVAAQLQPTDVEPMPIEGAEVPDSDAA